MEKIGDWSLVLGYQGYSEPTVGRYDLDYKASLTCKAPCIIFWIFNTLRHIYKSEIKYCMIFVCVL